ncbi:MAG: ABC transporter ATP-binding protein/permease [Verrucomicrobiales bacterium]|nr:ABC transporter ATP-binding protein/permease [Verrucomicrobiales bacterium]
MNTTFRVFAYLRRYPLLGSAQMFCAVLMTLLMLVFPQVTKHIVGDVIPNGNSGDLITAGLIALAAFAGTNLFNSLRIVINNTFEQRVIYDIRSDLYQKLQRLPMRWFDNKRTGDVMTRVTEDVTAMERVLIDGIEQGVVAILQIIAFGIWMAWQSPALAGIALIPLPLLIVGAFIYTLTAPQRYRQVRSTTSDMNSLLHDNLDGMQQIKTFTREKVELGNFNQSSDLVRRASLRVMKVWAIYSPGMELCRNLGYVLVLGFGGYWMITSEHGFTPSSIGTLTGFLVSLSLFYEPITRLHQLNQIIQQGRAAGERVFEIIDAEEELGLDDGVQLQQPVKGHVCLKNVGFSYDHDLPTLSEVSIEAKPGQTIALVGHTGAGKSTIINLLNRFYEYDSGSISIDGIDIHTVNKASLRAAIGYVTQESFLFNDSIRHNLELAMPGASDEKLWAALDVANARGFVERLPQGLETKVGERGVKLSVGEKQRISIARVVLKAPPILLLDEATASVDTETEKLIQEALEKLMADRTSFVIAHRLSTVRNADRIYVMDRGRAIEQGTHEELLQLDGHYATLARTSLIAEQKD